MFPLAAATGVAGWTVLRCEAAVVRGGVVILGADALPKGLDAVGFLGGPD